VQVDSFKTRVVSAYGFSASNYNLMEVLSTVAFKFKVRCYNTAAGVTYTAPPPPSPPAAPSPPPPLPPMTAAITAVISLSGYTAATFGDTQQTAFISAMAVTLAVRQGPEST
jgi:hypothetical protein